MKFVTSLFFTVSIFAIFSSHISPVSGQNGNPVEPVRQCQDLFGAVLLLVSKLAISLNVQDAGLLPELVRGLLDKNGLLGAQGLTADLLKSLGLDSSA